MHIVVVESPAKAKTINKYLGVHYKVFASFGHVRDLSAKNGSVLPDEDFSMKWNICQDAAERLSEIAKFVKKSNSLILATDPDREGEAISWHVLSILREKNVLQGKIIKRVVFNAITRKAVLDSISNPRDIDANLVGAYLARRALDYLFGFTLSQILWKKLPGARSAGRVQSVALRLICTREVEIERFVCENYWSITAHFRTVRGDVFTARLFSIENRKCSKLDIKTVEDAEKIRCMLESASFFKVQCVEEKPIKYHPFPPFTTSTLQQTLYEGIDLDGETTGLITYMRTDGVQMVSEAIDDARMIIKKNFGNAYLPDKPHFYSKKAKNAQEAHEAIRPTNFSRTPDSVCRFLDTDQASLYQMIWQRAVSSQMRSADIKRITIDIDAVNRGLIATLRATGSVTHFDGFLAAFNNPREKDDIANEDEENILLPVMHINEHLRCNKIIVSQHRTKPPPHYSEAALIKKLEELSIGRPSTYASILSILQDRGYVVIEKRKLVPQAKGRIVTAFLEVFFNCYVEYDFTADLEGKLDLISDGKLDWKNVLRDFWQHFSATVTDIKTLRIANVLEILNNILSSVLFPPKKDGLNPRSCPLCHTGQLSLKLGRHGAFVGCSDYPACKYTRQLGENSVIFLGQDSATGQDITLRASRFGHYVQQGDGKSAKCVSLPKSWKRSDMNLQKALLLFSLPKAIGLHPENGKSITANIGRYGPYIRWNNINVTLPADKDPISVTLQEALIMIETKIRKKSYRKKTVKTPQQSVS